MVDEVENETISSKFQKKQLGSFYTPLSLAERIATESLNSWLNERLHIDRENLIEQIRNLKILDPACGDGVFLKVAAFWLDKTLEELGDITPETERHRSILSNSLYGVDIDIEAVEDCRDGLLQLWNTGQSNDNVIREKICENIRRGNSLTSFDWMDEFSSIMKRQNPGFDVILGNPPYGNILSKKERATIQDSYPFIVGGNRTGTWNSAAHFIVKASTLLRMDGELGFLIPNSILRVKQFTKTREFLLEQMNLWKIIDEGSPFDGVTLEMVTIFCRNLNSRVLDEVSVESRRPNHQQKNSVKREILAESNIISIYHDDIFERILRRGQKGFLTATRGRDIPKAYVRRERSKQFPIPYITSGRSVRRYRIDKNYKIFTNDWYLRNIGMKESYANDWLVATKNYRYPRCVIKPKGMINGGGIVRIIPTKENIDLRALGLILNSKLIQYICTRYLTNYSQLTTCLNTGILEELPIAYPNHPEEVAFLFEMLSTLYDSTDIPKRESCINIVEGFSEALVYELYFMKEQRLEDRLSKILADSKGQMTEIQTLCRKLKTNSIKSQINEIMKLPIVKQIESLL